MATHNIDLVLDVGANEGQYAQRLRVDGFGGHIVSFEPLSKVFEELERRAAVDPNWECRRTALSDERGVERINVSEFSGTSSFLGIKDWLVTEAPRFGYVGTEEVSLVPLDSLSEELIRSEDRVLLKIDVQGYEQRVLAGARDTLPKIAMLECEMSLVSLYEGDPSLLEVLRWLESAGFALVSLEPTGYLPESGHVLQVDGIFVRRESQLDGLIR